ncbi:MAG: hypothetical protein ABH877_00660 [bacterium]
MKRYITDSNGKRHAVWLDFEEGTVEFAGMVEPQPVPEDRHDYRYTHGGGLYRLACDLYWKELSR